MSKADETDTVHRLTGELVGIIRPCLRDEEVALAREEFAAVVRRHLQRFAERLRDGAKETRILTANPELR